MTCYVLNEMRLLSSYRIYYADFSFALVLTEVLKLLSAQIGYIALSVTLYMLKYTLVLFFSGQVSSSWVLS